MLLGDASGGFAGTAQLRDQSLSISGSLGQYTEIEGKRYGHVIDPRSGEPLTQARVAGSADGRRRARGGTLEGAPDPRRAEGIALLESLPDAEGILIDESGQSWQTSGFTDAAQYEAEWPGEDD